MHLDPPAWILTRWPKALLVSAEIHSEFEAERTMAGGYDVLVRIHRPLLVQPADGPGMRTDGLLAALRGRPIPELAAIADLIEKHRAEYDAIAAGQVLKALGG
jgi:hypothetical protein